MHLTDIEMARKIAEAVAENGGCAYFVGGYVRDIIRGNPGKDVDIEIHGISPDALKQILSGLGQRMEIGESFGIFGLKGYSLDIAMPRTETNRGKGHKDFDIFVDPHIGTVKAAKRRDFTINALMQNILSGEIIDHFGGRDDLEKGIIRHIDPDTFVEDPLRVLRGAQFASRFGFTIADETIELCRGMDISTLARERVIGELEKALTKSDKPSIFFELMRKMGHLSIWFPELEALIGVEQNPKHHAEGDVWVHTMMVLDEVAKIRHYASDELGVMLSAITHDFGKAICTEIVKGEIHAYEHETKGLPIIESFMHRLTNEHKLIKYVLNLSEYHMKPNTLAAMGASIKSTNKMFDKSVDPAGLLCLAVADGLGKIAPREYISYDDFFIERLAIYREYMSRPHVTGQDLIDAGIQPSKSFSEYLEYAHKLRLAGIEKDSALRQTISYARKHK
ncbi:MAG: tRNA nucleotidyltransferase [Clostridia bacterium]|nr:tRNA nucleotidyltransferase [Clostridia bacterium]